MKKARSWVPALIAVATRPRLWSTAVRQGGQLVPRRWWRHAPHLPVPDGRYLRFRALTQYGDADRAPSAGDLVRWLEWCRQERAAVAGAEHHKSMSHRPEPR
jgi:hypothetical protein